MTTNDHIERLAAFSDKAGALLDSLDEEIQTITSSPFIAQPHPKLVEARKEAHQARLSAERASTLLREIAPDPDKSADEPERPVLTAEATT